MYYDYLFKSLSQEKLEEIVLVGKDMNLRKHAIKKLVNSEILKQIVLDMDEPQLIRDEAAKRLLELSK